MKIVLELTAEAELDENDEELMENPEKVFKVLLDGLKVNKGILRTFDEDGDEDTEPEDITEGVQEFMDGLKTVVQEEA